MTNQRTPQLAEALLGFVSGPYLQDEILGDLQERYATQNRPALWYWMQTLRSIPALIHMNLKNMSAHAWLMKALFILFGLALIWVWEIKVAQKLSWPAAKAILPYSPLTAIQTCKALYILIYVSALGSCVLGLTAWQKYRGKSAYFRQLHILLFALIASIPVIYYCINPGPYDGPINFRAFQMTLVWSLIIWAFIFPNLFRNMRVNKRRVSRAS